MADVTITAADVQLKGNATVERGIAGETLTQGEAVYKASDQKWYAADCTDAAKHAASGVVMTPAAADDYFQVATAGPIDIGGTLTVGGVYVLSVTGAFSPVADLESDDYVTIAGVATAADTLELGFISSGVQVP